MPVAKVIQVIGHSSESFAKAADEAVQEAAKTVRGITGADVVSMSAEVEDGRSRTSRRPSTSPSPWRARSRRAGRAQVTECRLGASFVPDGSSGTPDGCHSTTPARCRRFRRSYLRGARFHVHVLTPRSERSM